MGRWNNIVFALIVQLFFSWTFFVPASFADDPAPVDLDLTSGDRSFAASSVMGSAAQATIDLTSGVTKTFVPTDILTAAEMIAVRQVVNTGTQYLHVNDLGIATGGGFHVSYYATNLNNLVIPENVRASQNAALLQTLNLTGDLTNHGTFNVFSSNAAVTSATVNATNICNTANAVISSTLANLALNAVNNFTNAGTITSTGSVAATAGGTFTNSGVLQALQNMSVQANTLNNQAQIAATLGNLNIVTANLVNAGLLQSIAGQVNVSSPTNSTVILNNLNGILSGLNLNTIGGTVTIGTGSIGTIISSPSVASSIGSITLGASGNVIGGTVNITSSLSGGVITVSGATTNTSSNNIVISAGSNNIISTTPSSINLNISGNGVSTNGAPNLVVTISAGSQGNVGATDSQPAAAQTSSSETTTISFPVMTYVQSTTSTSVTDGKLVSGPVISTDINAVTPLAIFQQLPTSSMTTPVASTIMYTINGLNQVNMIPSTAQSSIIPFSLAPNPPQSAPSSAPGVQTPYQKIAYTTGAPGFTSIEKTTKQLSEIQFDTCLVRHSGNSDISYREGRVNLHSGEILVHSPLRTEVLSGEYLVSVNPGTVALITRENKVLKVRALYELHANGVAIKAGDNTIKLSVGQEVMLAPHSVHLKAADKNDCLGRRKIVEATLANGHAMSRSEFSHIGLIEEADVLTMLFRSPAPHDRQLSGKLMKIAACLMTVTGSHGAFSDK